jgi:hypothetical protein
MAAYRGSRGNEIENIKKNLSGTRSGTPSYLGDPDHETEHKKYATELVCQLEIVTIRNPQLAQYVKWVLFELFVLSFCSFGSSYLDIFISEYSLETVLAELARCLRQFPNLHTVQIDVDDHVVGSFRRGRSWEIFEQTFKNYSYPQIRNVFVMFYSVPIIASCPQAQHVGFTRNWSMTRNKSCRKNILRYCHHMEVLASEDFGDVFWTPYNACELSKDIWRIRNIPYISNSPDISKTTWYVFLIWKAAPYIISTNFVIYYNYTRTFIIILNFSYGTPITIRTLHCYGRKP